MLNILIEGSGPTLVWGHGLQGSIACEQTCSLFHAERPSLRRIRFDARGHGQSPACDDSAAYCWARLGADMLDVANLQPDAKVALGGQSMGCASALHAAVQAPWRVSHLILAIPPTAWDSRPAQVDKYRKAVALLGRRGMEAFMQASRLFPALPAWLREARPQLEPARLNALADFSVERLVPILKGAAESDLPPREALEGLRVPTLILAWTDDETHPLSTAVKLDDVMPESRLIVARTSDEVDRWPALIESFVRGLPDPSA